MAVSILTSALAETFTNAQGKLTGAPERGGVDFAATLEETNAPILEKRERQRKQTEMMKERILEVGIQRYTQEQRQVQKLMKALRVLSGESAPDVRAHLESITEYFEKNPQKNTDEMYGFISAYTEVLPDRVAERLKDTLERLRGLMELSDSELDKRAKRKEEEAA